MIDNFDTTKTATIMIDGKEVPVEITVDVKVEDNKPTAVETLPV